MKLAHATCVALDDCAVLLRGPSGSGKSDLALRLIDGGARLVADDQVMLSARDGRLWAAAPAAIAGMIEVRGIGVLRLPYLEDAVVGMVFDLVAPRQVPRLPEPAAITLAGIAVPCLPLAPFEASAPAKVRLAVRHHDAYMSST